MKNIAIIAILSALGTAVSLFTPSQDVLAPVAGVPTNYLIVGGGVTRRVSRGEFESRIDQCDPHALIPVTANGKRERVFVCRLDGP